MILISATEVNWLIVSINDDTCWVPFVFSASSLWMSSGEHECVT